MSEITCLYCTRCYGLTSISSLDSLFLQAHRASKQHLQEAFKQPLAALVDVQLVGQQREAVVLQKFLLLFFESSAEIGVQQLEKRNGINLCAGIQVWGLIYHLHTLGTCTCLKAG